MKLHTTVSMKRRYTMASFHASVFLRAIVIFSVDSAMYIKPKKAIELVQRSQIVMISFILEPVESKWHLNRIFS